MMYKNTLTGVIAVLFLFIVQPKQAFGFDECSLANEYGYRGVSNLYNDVYLRYSSSVIKELDRIEEIYDDIPSESINETNCIGQTSLMTLFRKDDFKIRNLDDWRFEGYSSEDILEELLDVDAIDVNAQDNEGNTALHHAVKNYTPEYAELLLEYSDLDPNIQNNEGMTPLHLLFFSYKRQDDIVEWLNAFLDVGSVDWNLTDNYNHNILGLIRHEKYFKKYPRLFSRIERKTDNPLPESNELSFLEMAMTLEPCRTYFDKKLPWRVCGFEPFNALVEGGVDINFTDPNGDGATAIYYLLWRFSLFYSMQMKDENELVEQMISLLFSKEELDISAIVGRGDSALVNAIQAGRIEWVKKILDRPNNNLNLLYDDRYSPIYTARDNEILSLLCDQPDIDFSVGRSLETIINEKKGGRAKIIFNSPYFIVNKTILKYVDSASRKETTKALFDTGKVSPNASFGFSSRNTPYIFSKIFFGLEGLSKREFEYVSMILNHPQSSLLLRSDEGNGTTIADFMAQYNPAYLPALFQAAESRGGSIYW